jgi:hypothetical protein
VHIVCIGPLVVIVHLMEIQMRLEPIGITVTAFFLIEVAFFYLNITLTSSSQSRHIASNWSHSMDSSRSKHKIPFLGILFFILKLPIVAS